MTIFAILAVVFLLAFMVESLVEYLLGEPFDHIPRIAPHRWMLKYAALLVGIVGASIYQLDLIHLLSEYVTPKESAQYIIPIHTFGIVLTGATIGRGANYLHGIVSKFFKPNPLGNESTLSVTHPDGTQIQMASQTVAEPPLPKLSIDEIIPALDKSKDPARGPGVDKPNP